MENLFGDVMSDLCAGLVGGLGVVPGANIGQRYAGVRGGARQRAGHRRQGRWPTRSRLLRSAAMMLDAHRPAGTRRDIEQSVRKTLQAGVGLTRDLGGNGNTASITEQLIANL